MCWPAASSATIAIASALLACAQAAPAPTATPTDEVPSQGAMDLSGRPYLVYNVRLPKVKIGEFDVELAREFFQALTNNLGANLHINVMYGDNVHHMLEACFKATARALDMATQLDPRIQGVMSTKGKL